MFLLGRNTCLLCYCLVAYLAQVTHLAGKFCLHCCLFALLLPCCISGTSHTPCREVLSALLPVCSAIALLHIWHKSHTLPGSSICTHLAGKFHLHCCLFAPLLPDPLPIRTSPAPPASSLLFSFSSFLVFCLVHQSKSQVSSQVRSRLLDQLGLSSALPLPCHTYQVSGYQGGQELPSESLQLEGFELGYVSEQPGHMMA